jgi:hypothetical protein
MRSRREAARADDEGRVDPLEVKPIETQRARCTDRSKWTFDPPYFPGDSILRPFFVVLSGETQGVLLAHVEGRLEPDVNLVGLPVRVGSEPDVARSLGQIEQFCRIWPSRQ